MQAQAPDLTSSGVRLSSAASQNPDPAAAADELALALGKDAALYVVFATLPYDLDTLAARLTDLWGERVIGCTSTRFFGPSCAGSSSVMAVALAGDLRASTVPIRPLDHLARGLSAAETGLRRERDAARDAAREGRQTFALLLVDGLSMQEEQLVSALTLGLGGIQLIGGSASDDLSFSRTLVLAGGKFRENAATCTFLTTAAPATTFRFQHYWPCDDTLVITSATPERRLVHEINGIPAAAAYAEAIGLTPRELTSDIVGAHPLVLRAGDASWVRAVAQVCDDGTLRFFAAIDTGAVLRLADPTDPIEAMRAGFDSVREKIGEVTAVLAFDCVLRHAEFQRTGVDSEVASELSRHGVHGFSTYGEQYDDMHINQTIVGIAFGNGLPSPSPASSTLGAATPEARPPSQGPSPVPEREPEVAACEEPATTLARLSAEVARLDRINRALVDAAERRLAGADASSSFGRWEQTLTLHRVVEERTEQARATELLLRSVIDSIDGRMCIVARDGTVLGTNKLWDEAFPEGIRMARARGSRPGQVGFAVGSNLFEILQDCPPDMAVPVTAAVRDVLEDSSPFREVRGEWHRGDMNETFTLRVHRVRDHAEAEAVLIMVDITDALRTQENLRRVTGEARLLDRVVRQMDNSVFIVGSTGSIEWVNDAFCRISGYSRDEIIGTEMTDLLALLRIEMDFEHVVTSRRTGSIEVEVPGRRSDGSPLWTEWQIQTFMEDGEEHVILVARDVTSRRQAEEELAIAHQQTERLAGELMKEKALLDHVLASIPQIVYWKDLDLRYAGVNETFSTVRGVRDVDVLGRAEEDLPTPDALSEVLPALERQVLASGEAVLDVRVVMPCPSGPARQFFVSVLPQMDTSGIRGVIGVAADVTQLSELERQVAQSTRLEAIGQLAAGIAHEINTPVQFVSDNTRFIAECFDKILPALGRIGELVTGTCGGCSGDTPTELDGLVRDLDIEFIAEEAPSALAQSLEGLGRVADIVRAMKDFAHPGRERTETDLNRAVESTVQVSRNEWKYVAECHVDLDPEVGSVPCFEGEIKQALLNLIVNAAHAIGEQQERAGRTGSGRIQITTRRAGDTVVIEVSDDGPGMTEEIKARIFDPFFTTKEIGKGTGQGLSLVHATIVQKHQGRIDVETAPGRGARFVIILPAPVMSARSAAATP